MRPGLARVVVIWIAPAVSLAESAALRELKYRLNEIDIEMSFPHQTIRLGAAAP